MLGTLPQDRRPRTRSRPGTGPGVHCGCIALSGIARWLRQALCGGVTPRTRRGRRAAAGGPAATSGRSLRHDLHGNKDPRARRSPATGQAVTRANRTACTREPRDAVGPLRLRCDPRHGYRPVTAEGYGRPQKRGPTQPMPCSSGHAGDGCWVGGLGEPRRRARLQRARPPSSRPGGSRRRRCPSIPGTPRPSTAPERRQRRTRAVTTRDRLHGARRRRVAAGRDVDPQPRPPLDAGGRRPAAARSRLPGSDWAPDR